MLSEATGNAWRRPIPRDYSYTDSETVAQPPDGTSAAVVRVSDHWQEIDPSQAWFWTPGWQDGERRVDDYALEGNVETFDTMEEFLRTLGE